MLWLVSCLTCVWENHSGLFVLRMYECICPVFKKLLWGCSISGDDVGCYLCEYEQNYKGIALAGNGAALAVQVLPNTDICWSHNAFICPVLPALQPLLSPGKRLVRRWDLPCSTWISISNMQIKIWGLSTVWCMRVSPEVVKHNCWLFFSLTKEKCKLVEIRLGMLDFLVTPWDFHLI